MNTLFTLILICGFAIVLSNPEPILSLVFGLGMVGAAFVYFQKMDGRYDGN